MPFAKRGDVVHSEATSGFNNQKKSLLINGLAALGDSHHPLHLKPARGMDLCVPLSIKWPHWTAYALFPVRTHFALLQFCVRNLRLQCKLV